MTQAMTGLAKEVLMRRFALIAALVLPASFVACGSDEEIPTAAATPSPTPAGYSCPLPPGSNPTLNCGKGTPRLSEAVNVSIDTLMSRFPGIFNLNDVNGGNPKVVNPVRYYEELVNELGNTWGVCTKVQAEEISIKHTNNYSEDWIVLTSGNYVRRRYQGTCTPAWW
jgi:hypothetical protein